MKWFADYKHPQQLYFIIRKDRSAGFYILMYQNADFFKQDLQGDRCPNHQEDDLQDTLEKAKEFALRIYGVPLDVWKPVVQTP